MTARLRELAERWADRLDRNAKHATALMPDDSAELAGIVRAYIKRLDADGEGDGVELADNELPGMWSSADFTGGDPDERPRFARSGGVSDADVRDAAIAYSKRATDGSQDVNFHDCIRAALTHFAKGDRHE